MSRVAIAERTSQQRGPMWSMRDMLKELLTASRWPLAADRLLGGTDDGHYVLRTSEWSAGWI